MHLVNHLFPDPEALFAGAAAMARQIAEQSPVAVQSSKAALNHARDSTVAAGLHYSVLRNSMILPNPDLAEAFMAFTEKRKPRF